MHAKIIARPPFVRRQICYIYFALSLHIYITSALNYLVTFSIWIKREQVKCFSFTRGRTMWPPDNVCASWAFWNMTSGQKSLDLVVSRLDFCLRKAAVQFAAFYALAAFCWNELCFCALHATVKQSVPLNSLHSVSHAAAFHELGENVLLILPHFCVRLPSNQKKKSSRQKSGKSEIKLRV